MCTFASKLVISATLALGCLGGLTSPSAAAPLAPQSDSELRLENERLRQRVQKLEADLAVALAKIRELEEAAAEPRPGRVPPPPDATSPTPPAPPGDAPGPASSAPSSPTNPLDSSQSILDAIRARFAADFAGKQAPQEGGSDELLSRRWFSDVERWMNGVNRELRRPITWNVRVISTEQSGRSIRMEVICVDPSTGTDVGRPFFIQLQQPQTGPYDLAVRTGTAGGDFTLRGVFIPQVTLNPTRYEAGTFDNPPFIGTFVEYGFRITVTSLVPSERRSGRSPSTPTDRSAPSGSGGTAPGGMPPSTPADAPPGAGGAAP
ncbi:MAG: hypothetical protein KF724_05025 [Phycisphaeraceae bacterium]|nr:hypothetical protein [Phycisphaeraceae bacterium]